MMQTAKITNVTNSLGDGGRALWKAPKVVNSGIGLSTRARLAVPKTHKILSKACQYQSNLLFLFLFLLLFLLLHPN